MSRLAHLGAVLSDLTAQLFAFAVENETGQLLEVRRREIHGTLKSIAAMVDAPRTVAPGPLPQKLSAPRPRGSVPLLKKKP